MLNCLQGHYHINIAAFVVFLGIHVKLVFAGIYVKLAQLYGMVFSG